MFRPRAFVVATLLIASCAAPSSPTVHAADIPGANRLEPNLEGHLERPLRYRPEGEDFVIENGSEFFNRSLYGGNTAFRVDGGDKPEFLLYLPGRGGNLRWGVRAGGTAKWLNDAAQITTRYRPGELTYTLRDPLLGATGELRLTAVAYAATEGLSVSVAGQNLPDGVEVFAAFGGMTGQRGKRDGDIGTESVPISQYFQLKPEFCRGNLLSLDSNGFILRGKPGALAGTVSAGASVRFADARAWSDVTALLSSATKARAPELPLALVFLPLRGPNASAVHLALQRLPADEGNTADLDVYREVTAPRGEVKPPKPTLPPLPRFTPAELARRMAETQQHFDELRRRVSVDTPDPFFNAAVGALNVAADAVWDAPEQAIMHGAIAWRTKLLGWRGPYALDALGWHDRARANLKYWAGRQNTSPIPAEIPPPDENANLARNEAGLHSNGDLSNSHYDMNLVYIDMVFRHLRWTGDLQLARELWPMIERHLAWERRLFRREYGREKRPLYEAYAAIWASDDLQYSGGGAAHASAYNAFHHREAARLARLLGVDPTPYEREAQAIVEAMRQLLWLPEEQTFAEYKDWLGLQRVHPSPALWTYYHIIDSEIPTAEESWTMTQHADRTLPRLPVHGPEIPNGLFTLGTSRWMPYQWSINNVVLSEVMHGALAYWQAGRPEAAWLMTKGSLLAAMYMGISPGNVGSMSYLDVYRRESQRDFADGSGTLSRAVVEGLFGVRPNLLEKALTVAPGWPREWDHAALVHPDLSLRYRRNGDSDTYELTQSLAPQLRLRLQLRVPTDDVSAVMIDGKKISWRPVADAIAEPRIEVEADIGAASRITIAWSGKPLEKPRAENPRVSPASLAPGRFSPVRQGAMQWLEPQTVDAGLAKSKSDGAGHGESPRIYTLEFPEETAKTVVDLSGSFNDRITQIFKNEYRAPRSPFVSLSLPKQGLGGWAGGVNTTAEIDDRGLRAEAAKGGGMIHLPRGIPLATPAAPEEKNVVFVSQWNNYPREAEIALEGKARGMVLLLAGTTGPMQSQFENGEILVAYADGGLERFPLENPTNWWPIEQDYFLDDYQFARPGPLPTRVDLKTGKIRELNKTDFRGKGGSIPGGAATVLEFPLQSGRALKSITLRATANDVVIGLMALTLVR